MEIVNGKQCRLFILFYYYFFFLLFIYYYLFWYDIIISYDIKEEIYDMILCHIIHCKVSYHISCNITLYHTIHNYVVLLVISYNVFDLILVDYVCMIWNHIISPYIIPCIISFYMVDRYQQKILYHIISYHIILYYIILYYIISYQIILYYILPYHVIS